ncbi:type II toxin-antitoxin system RnlB family antitoxin [Clostridium paraputrificum]|uniref:type II toxin-antitoxin system RnlB family antitoxin n=1 Tax=Clostridium paraputrificum TaxID=29363 RepID=UPI000EA03651|nr:type II toxin-antitoxin system RnlB family antitoxin [Clostridium paraputrificum]MDC0800767.1 type II toxin-antitoxin system RnlB family antitoxin [Clostridium paraputrificum]RKI45314.1 type II toxin-antitoxin system RnlB family antitoxin [Clostridium paraputrificum]
MENFKIKRIDDRHEYIILSTSYISPLDELFDLEEQLKQLEYKGKIIFDLLLCNGLERNRFLETFFDGDFVDLSSISILYGVDERIKKISRSFYKENLDILETSILSDAHKYIVKNGLI